MTQWRVKFTDKGEADFNRFDRGIKKRIVAKLRWLENNFSNITPELLSYDLNDFYKLRVTDWRVIYEIDRSAMHLVVHRIERRDKVYKI